MPTWRGLKNTSEPNLREFANSLEGDLNLAEALWLMSISYVDIYVDSVASKTFELPSNSKISECDAQF